jgi:hypothetical protein
MILKIGNKVAFKLSQLIGFISLFNILYCVTGISEACSGFARGSSLVLEPRPECGAYLCGIRLLAFLVANDDFVGARRETVCVYTISERLRR